MLPSRLRTLLYPSIQSRSHATPGLYPRFMIHRNTRTSTRPKHLYLLYDLAIDALTISITLCISVIFQAAPHNLMSSSSKKFAQGKGIAIACGKAKKLYVKPQNIVGLFKRTQCPFFRQTADRSLYLSLFSIDTPIIHRVIHRSWGTPYQSHIDSMKIEPQGEFRSS